jgi:hypothetical protein
MSRSIRLIAALAAIASLALAGIALAKPAKHTTHINGGTTAVTLSAAAANVLKTNGLVVKPISPATLSGKTMTFPIGRGRLNAKMHGFVLNKGGFSFSNGTKTVRLRKPSFVSNKGGVSIWALAPVHSRTVCGPAKKHCKLVINLRVARIGRVTGVKITGTTATGTVRLTALSAGFINTLAGKKVAAAGNPIGTVTVTPTFG